MVRASFTARRRYRRHKNNTPQEQIYVGVDGWVVFGSSCPDATLSEFIVKGTIQIRTKLLVSGATMT
jgi:hypothetical protein